MPVTPFHFGPGAALHAVAPKQVSFIAFCAANVFIDVESGYNLLQGNDRVHAFLHSYVGATLVIAATVALFVVLNWFANRYPLPNLFEWRDLKTRQVLIRSALGAYSHVALDSIMHADMTPFYPLTDANPMLRLVSLDMLHTGCVALGVLGAGLVAVRLYRSRG